MTEQLRKRIKEFVAAKGNYNAEQISYLRELKSGLHSPVIRAAFIAKGLI